MTEQNSDIQEQDGGTEVEVEITDAPQENNAPQQDDLAGFDPAHDRVEISDPKVQAKFNNLYKQVKMSDSRNQLYWDMIQRQQEQLEELQGRFQQTDSAEVERTLQNRLQDARDEGDIAKENRVLQELIDYRVQKATAKPQAPKPTLAQLDPEAQQVVQMAQQTDSRGNLLHGWISADHPKHNTAVKMAAIMATQMNAEEGYIDIPTIIEKVTESMTKQTAPAGNRRAPDPMSGSNLTKNPSKGKIRLSSQEMAIAQKLGVKPEDYAKWKK